MNSLAIRFLRETFSPAGMNSNFANKNNGFKGSYFIGEISGASNEISGSCKRRFRDKFSSIDHCGARTQISSAFFPDFNSEFIIVTISVAKLSLEIDLQ